MQAPVFTFLTSWPLEDLISPFNGISATSGALFDRLEVAVREDPNPSKRRSITCAHLKTRCKPKRPPPRVLVFTGPAGAAKRAVMAGMVAAYPSLFAKVVTHTSRRPKEHEVDGVDYHFTDAPSLRCCPPRLHKSLQCGTCYPSCRTCSHVDHAAQQHAACLVAAGLRAGGGMQGLDAVQSAHHWQRWRAGRCRQRTSCWTSSA